jgi:hypothetical protein
MLPTYSILTGTISKRSAAFDSQEFSMNTRLLMTASALVLALLGLPCVFAPDLVLKQLTGGTSAPAELIVQVTGALYFGFAGLNWMGKANLIGGIYGRPVAIGNLTHFLVAGIALLKAAPGASQPVILWTLAVIYAALAAAFAYIVFGKRS